MISGYIEAPEQAANLMNHQPGQEVGGGSFVRGLSMALAAPMLLFLFALYSFGSPPPTGFGGITVVAMLLWMLATPGFLVFLFCMGSSKLLPTRVASGVLVGAYVATLLWVGFWIHALSTVALPS